MALKIAPTVINGEDRVAPETMELLIEFGGHCDVCEKCESYRKNPSVGDYCVTGSSLVFQLLERPDVSYQPE